MPNQMRRSHVATSEHMWRQYPWLHVRSKRLLGNGYKSDGLSDLSCLQPDQEMDKGWTCERFYCCLYSKMACDSHMEVLKAFICIATMFVVGILNVWQAIDKLVT